MLGIIKLNCISGQDISTYYGWNYMMASRVFMHAEHTFLPL